MNRTKTAKELKAELEKALHTLDKAIRNERICGIEKDMILERLRKVYDGVQWMTFDCPEEEKGAEGAILEVDLPKQEASAFPAAEDSDPVEIRSTQEITVTDRCSGEETTLRIEEEVQTTMEELIEKPFIAHSPINREIIDSLYGESAAPCLKAEEKEVSPDEPADRQPASAETPDKPVGETFAPAGKALNETLASPQKDIASVLSAQANGKLRNAIGLNDRLMLLNDLFENDSERLDRTMDALDECDNIEDAYIYLYEHFTMDDSRDGVKLLISLLETKFG